MWPKLLLTNKGEFARARTQIAASLFYNFIKTGTLIMIFQQCFLASLVAVITLILASSASADLVLVVNTANQTFSLRGSDTGTPGGTNIAVDGANQSNGGVFFWQLDNAAGPASGRSTILDTQGSLFSAETLLGAPLATGSLVDTGGSPIHDVQLQALTDVAGGTDISFFLRVGTLGQQTITGNETFHSYAGLENRAGLFESAIGTTLISAGSRLGDLAVVAVPEPSSAAVIGVFTLWAFGVRRKSA